MKSVRSILRRVGATLLSHGPLVSVLFAFFGARIYCRVGMGVQFDATPLDYFLQFVDKELLRTDLLRTTFYLQHQAPFLNFLSGLALKISPTHYGDILDATFFLGALTLTLSFFSILKNLGVRPWLAAIGTILYTTSPWVLFYELWLIYHHFVTVFLVLSVAMLLRFVRKETLGSGIAFFVSLTFVVLTRATFGLVFMAAAASILLLYRPMPRKLVLKAAAGPMLFVLLYTIKTPIQTGHSLGHSLVGPNLVQKMMAQLPSDERERLFQKGVLSPMDRYEPFPHLVRMPQFRVANVPETGVPVLDQLQNSNGSLNSNSLQYTYISDEAMVEAKYLIKHYPGAYARSLRSAVFQGYFKGATNDMCAPRSPAHKTLADLDKRFTKFLKPERDGTLLGLEVGLPLALFYAALKLLSPRSRLPSRRTVTPAIAFVLMTILYSSSALLISYADFSRYRFEVDVLYAILLTLLANDVLDRVTAAVRWALVRFRARALVTA